MLFFYPMYPISSSWWGVKTFKCQTENKVLSVVSTWHLANQTAFIWHLKNYLRLYSTGTECKLLV